MRRMLLAALATCATVAAGAALAQEGPPPGMRMPAPEDIFKRWDTNSDGVVDKAEWTAAGRPDATGRRPASGAAAGRPHAAKLIRPLSDPTPSSHTAGRRFR